MLHETPALKSARRSATPVNRLASSDTRRAARDERRERTKQRRGLVGEVELLVVERVAQRDNQGRVALDDEIAREEQRVAVIGAVDEAEQRGERAGDARVALDRERRGARLRAAGGCGSGERRNAMGRSVGSIITVLLACSPSRSNSRGRRSRNQAMTQCGEPRRRQRRDAQGARQRGGKLGNKLRHGTITRLLAAT